MTNWKKMDLGNYVMNFRGGYVSYNPDTALSAKLSPTIGFINDFVMGLSGEKDGKETALFLYRDKKWRILSGDFRKQYEKCKTIKDRIEVYKANIKHRKNVSTD